jgi:hypothetical protein
LWFRKKVRAWRIGRAQAWLRAHIWLGLVCLPLLVLHSGFRLGGVLSTVLMVLLVIVIVSGIWGLVLQQWLPGYMLDRVAAETIYSQIEGQSRQLLVEARDLVRVTCGAMPEEAEAESADGWNERSESFVVVGAVRKVGRVQGKVLETRVAGPVVAGSEGLRVFFDGAVDAYLRKGRRSDSPLVDRERARQLFQGLRNNVPPAARAAVDTLEGLCAQRRQLDLQARLHFWLHSWLWVHLPLSAALAGLMFWHMWAALYYW